MKFPRVWSKKEASGGVDRERIRSLLRMAPQRQRGITIGTLHFRDSWINDCKESVRVQLYQDLLPIEHIVLDNHKNERTTGEGRREILRRRRFDIGYFVDDDDRLCNEHSAYLMWAYFMHALYVANVPNLWRIRFARRLIDENGRVLGVIRALDMGMFRADLLDKAGGWPTEHIGDDGSITQLTAKAGLRECFSFDCFSDWRWHQQQGTQWDDFQEQKERVFQNADEGKIMKYTLFLNPKDIGGGSDAPSDSR